MQTVDAAVQLIKMIGTPQVGLALDAWHWHLGGGTLEQLRSLSDRIITVSLADADRSRLARRVAMLKALDGHQK